MGGAFAFGMALRLARGLSFVNINLSFLVGRMNSTPVTPYRNGLQFLPRPLTAGVGPPHNEPLQRTGRATGPSSFKRWLSPARPLNVGPLLPCHPLNAGVRRT